ncbi:hypothetical protein CGMCC3_g1968 [Colletotrichum fructicola]|nr:uncharacterized protein CGMCC3_g1968 [Colletotrichum fructicola]KAE9581744.1 hypothetical protein CGMCC3_g1968 [Colletotrichum fructicola]
MGVKYTISGTRALEPVGFRNLCNALKPVKSTVHRQRGEVSLDFIVAAYPLDRHELRDLRHGLFPASTLQKGRKGGNTFSTLVPATPCHGCSAPVPRHR